MKKLEVGSGRANFNGYLTLDIDPATGADYIHDIETPWPFSDSEFSEIRLHHVLEHVRTEKKTFVMREVWRVLESGGIADIELPVFPSPQGIRRPPGPGLFRPDTLPDPVPVPDLQARRVQLVDRAFRPLRLRAGNEAQRDDHHDPLQGLRRHAGRDLDVRRDDVEKRKTGRPRVLRFSAGAYNLEF